MSVLATHPLPSALARRRAPSAPALAAAAVLAQIAYPLVPRGSATSALTIATVLLFTAAVLVDAGRTRGLRLLLIAGGVGFLAEVVGVHTGWPFGSYAYTDGLGPGLAGVPLLIPLAWTMMAGPALAVGRRLGRSRLGVMAWGAGALASWDLFLDPQMVHAGFWRWAPSGLTLNGIPIVNHLGWLATALVLMPALERAVPNAERDAVPLALWLWTFASSVLANVAFFGRPSVAFVGGLGMGVVALPLVRRLLPP